MRRHSLFLILIIAIAAIFLLSGCGPATCVGKQDCHKTSKLICQTGDIYEQIFQGDCVNGVCSFSANRTVLDTDCPGACVERLGADPVCNDNAINCGSACSMVLNVGTPVTYVINDKAFEFEAISTVTGTEAMLSVNGGNPTAFSLGATGDVDDVTYTIVNVSSGWVILTAQVAGASLCGNWAIDVGELCDDGPNPNQNCAYGETSCMVCTRGCGEIAGATSYCGDGYPDTTNGEVCDSNIGVQCHNATTGYWGTKDCTATCDWTACVPYQYCGDGQVNGKEVCDDGNEEDGDGCSSTCMNECPVAIPSAEAEAAGTYSCDGYDCTLLKDVTCSTPDSSSYGVSIDLDNTIFDCAGHSITNSDTTASNEVAVGMYSDYTQMKNCVLTATDVGVDVFSHDDEFSHNTISAPVGIRMRAMPSRNLVCENTFSATMNVEVHTDDDDIREGIDGSGTGNCGDLCGNGVVDQGEVCDDGNEEDGDGCSSMCMNECPVAIPSAEAEAAGTYSCDGYDCTLLKDVTCSTPDSSSYGVSINFDHIVFDCAGHSITNLDTTANDEVAIGMYSYHADIKNCVLTATDIGMDVFDRYGTFFQNTISAQVGIRMRALPSKNLVCENTFDSTTNVEVHAGDDDIRDDGTGAC